MQMEQKVGRERMNRMRKKKEKREITGKRDRERETHGQRNTRAEKHKVVATLVLVAPLFCDSCDASRRGSPGAFAQCDDKNRVNHNRPRTQPQNTWKKLPKMQAKESL